MATPVTPAAPNMLTNLFGSKGSQMFNATPEGQGLQISAADRSAQKGLLDANESTLGQFRGPVNQSPFYKSLLTTGTEATSNAYDSARANARARANMAGFNSTQPAEQGAESEMAGREAAALSEVPTKALSEAVQPELAAANLTAGEASSLGNQGLGYFTGGVVPLEVQNQQANQGFWNSLANIAGSLIP